MALFEFEKRVVDERDQLQERLEKLVKFIESETYKRLPEIEQNRLLRQSYCMYLYLDVLEERIHDFTEDDANG